MSLRTFPFRLPADQPPPARGEIKDGRVTPTYVLAWTCDTSQFYRGLQKATGREVSFCNFSGVVGKNWNPDPVDGLKAEPIPFPGIDGNYYLVALSNRPNVDHKRRVLDLKGDPLISSARAAMGVDDEDVEGTLQWLRWPLNWVAAERRERLRRQYEEMEAAGTLPPELRPDPPVDRTSAKR